MEHTPVLQFVLVGADGVGKTSLALRIYGSDPIENLGLHQTNLNVSLLSVQRYEQPQVRAVIWGQKKERRNILFYPLDTVDASEYDRYTIGNQQSDLFGFHIHLLIIFVCLQISSRLRPLSYCAIPLFAFCASIDSFESFVHCAEKYLREIDHHCRNTPFILVGTKADLRKHSPYNHLSLAVERIISLEG